MKKILALILVAAALASFAGCNLMQPKREPMSEVLNVLSDEEDKQTIDTDKKTTEAKTEAQTLTEIPDISVEDVNSIRDFKEKLEKSGYDVADTKNDDGSITVELKTPDKDSDTSKKDDATVKPAVPTIDKVIIPEKNEETKEKIREEIKLPEPSEEENKQPEPETAPEPEKEPEKEIEGEIEINPNRLYTYTTNQKHNEVKVTDRYLYSLLNEQQKKWYLAIDKAIRNLEPSVCLEGYVYNEENRFLYFMYMMDNPEHFYLGNTYTNYNRGNGSTSFHFSYSDGKNYCAYGHNPNEITEELRASIVKKKAIFDAEVERIVSTIPSDAPDVVKEKLIYDRILMDSFYNLGARWNGICEDNWNAYGIIVNKYGVCESYAEAFQTLCLKVGINCTGVVGDAGGGHKWNAVQLDGQWYICDITFDDPIGGEPGAAYHYYFNLTTKRMQELNHSTKGSDYPGPIATATKYSYQNSFGE